MGKPSISIHAPREGGDTVKNDYPNAFIKISIHAPREGGDGDYAELMAIVSISIHAPREGGDGAGGHFWSDVRHFNPRPPRGGRPGPEIPNGTQI